MAMVIYCMALLPSVAVVIHSIVTCSAALMLSVALDFIGGRGCLEGCAVHCAAVCSPHRRYPATTPSPSLLHPVAHQCGFDAVGGLRLHRRQRLFRRLCSALCCRLLAAWGYPTNHPSLSMTHTITHSHTPTHCLSLVLVVLI